MSFLELSVAHSVLGFTTVIGECLPVKHESRALARGYKTSFMLNSTEHTLSTEYR